MRGRAHRLLTGALIAAVGAAMGAGSSAQEKDESPGVARAREGLTALKGELEKLREAQFRAPVPVRGETNEGFKKAMLDELDKTFPESKAKPCSRALGRLGLIPAGWDIRKGILEANADQALAFYDNEKKYFGILRPDELEGDEGKAALIHELAHALQDQRFDLEHYDKALHGQDEDDLELARTCIVEGEATYVMLRWATKGKREHLRFALESLAQSTVKETSIKKKKAAGEPLDKSDELPLFYYRAMFEPYSQGALAVAHVFDKGGWKAVDELFTRPPASTEQILHPQKLVGTRDEPVTLSLPDLAATIGEGWKKSAETTLGELGLHCYLVERGQKDAADVAAGGWGGDRLTAFEKDDQGTTLLWFTTWDSVADAEEFEAAVAKIEKADPRTGESLVLRREKDVAIVEGAPAGRARPLLEAALERTKRAGR